MCSSKIRVRIRCLISGFGLDSRDKVVRIRKKPFCSMAVVRHRDNSGPTTVMNSLINIPRSRFIDEDSGRVASRCKYCVVVARRMDNEKTKEV